VPDSPNREERSLPVFCPACHKPVTLTVDTRLPMLEPQAWRCPHRGCGLTNTATFDAKITWVGRRAVRMEPPQ